MALCRWSSSAWYIFDVSNRTIEVCLFGQFSIVDILRRYSEIEEQAKSEGYSFLERLELRAYLKLWALFKMKKLTYKQYSKGLNFLRTTRKVEQYLKNPWDFEEIVSKGIPKTFQIKPVLCNKALAKYEERRKKK